MTTEEKELLLIYMYKLRNLMEIYRYQNKFRLKKRTIAEHQWSCAKIAETLVYWESILTDKNIDMGAILERSVLNGTIKIFTGEIQSGVKNKTSEIRDAITKMQEQIFDLKYAELLPPSMVEKMKECVLYGEKDSTVEGMIVEISTVIDTMFEAIEEILLGNSEKFTEVYLESVERIYAFKGKLEIIDYVLYFCVKEKADVLCNAKISEYISSLDIPKPIGKCENLTEFDRTFYPYLFEIRGVMEIYRYQNRYRNQKRTVAEHQWSVAIICLITHYILNKEVIGGSKSNEELGNLLARAINHDNIELFSGDILSGTKRTSVELAKAITDVEIKIYENNYIEMLPCVYPERILQSYRNNILNPKDSTIVGEILSLADVLDTVFEAYEEIVQNNLQFIEVYNSSVAKLFQTEISLGGEFAEILSNSEHFQVMRCYGAR